MTDADLEAVLKIESAAYVAPWTRGNFVDSLASGYLAWCLHDGGDEFVGYIVAMRGAAEMHLLNLAVAPERQGQGHASHLLDALVAHCRATAVTQLWLEVRASNARARELYRRRGLAEVGLRKGYYPATPGAASSVREDAVVMSLVIEGRP